MVPARAADQKLLSAGRALFARQGFDATSLRDISRIAGLTFGSVVYHFGSKRALYEAVVASCARSLEGRAREASEEGQTPAERLLSVTAALVEHVREHPEIPALLLQEVAAGRPPPAPAVRGLGQLVELLVDLARPACSVNDEPGSPPDGVARSILYHVLGGSIVERALDADAAPELEGGVPLTGIDDLVRSALERGTGDG